MLVGITVPLAFGSDSLPSSEDYEFEKLSFETCHEENPQCFGTFSNGTTIPIQCDFRHSCGIVAFESNTYKIFQKPPLKQFSLGIQFEEIQCRENLSLIQKNDGTPACVKPESVERILERKWTHPEWKVDYNEMPNLNKILIDKLRTGETTILTQEFIENEAKKDSIVNDWLKDTDYLVECCMFQIDRNSFPLYQHVGIVFEIPTKNTSITVTYDLDQQKITHVSSGPYGSKYMPNEVGLSDVPAGITVLEPNAMEFFYYPNPRDTENRDVFGLFLLIRLPEWLGGDAETSSAYRAYSAVSLSVDHCLVKYWDDTRQRIEQPCIGGIYRTVDGLLIQNVDPVMITTPRALPYLELITDDEGNLYVEPPTWNKKENGVIGYGKEMTIDEIRQGSEFLISSFEVAYPEFPDIPLTFAGFTLADITPMDDSADLIYLDFTSMRGHQFMHIAKSTTQEQNYFSNLAMPSTEIWQVEDTLIRSKGSMTEFYKDGFQFRIEGQNSNFIRQEIVSNFFPEYSSDDLFLVTEY